jgi:hypothetical protein
MTLAALGCVHRLHGRQVLVQTSIRRQAIMYADFHDILQSVQ